MTLGARAAPRLRWQVVVTTGDRLDVSQPARPLAWHMVGCMSTSAAAAHCAEGGRLLARGADPDGHCLILSRCPRCDAERKTGPD
jgi:hypothetical protein